MSQYETILNTHWNTPISENSNGGTSEEWVTKVWTGNERECDRRDYAHYIQVNETTFDKFHIFGSLPENTVSREQLNRKG